MKVRFDQVCVYTHSVNGVIVYVGAGSAARAFNISNRPKRWRDVVSNGYEVAITGWFDRLDAMKREADLIKQYRPILNLVGNGYVSPGAIGNRWAANRIWTPEMKAKLSASQKLSWQKTKRNTGRRRPTKPIRCIDTGIIYHGLREAARKTGAHFTSISACINGHNITASGLRFERLEG